MLKKTLQKIKQYSDHAIKLIIGSSDKPHWELISDYADSESGAYNASDMVAEHDRDRATATALGQARALCDSHAAEGRTTPAA